jgi:NADH pyrophosphatase NudC (nudix superfamily)
MMKRCPGTKELVGPRIIIRTCPACGEEVEFFGYETEAKCDNCGRTLHREATPSCITWCKYALKCIADLRERKLITPSRAEELEKIAKAAKTDR